NEKTIRGFLGARLLVVDETSRVSDALYPAVRPMLAVSRGRHQQPNAVADRRWHSLETIWWSIGWGTSGVRSRADLARCSPPSRRSASRLPPQPTQPFCHSRSAPGHAACVVAVL